MGAFQSKNSYQVEKEEKKKGVDQTKRTSYKQDSPNTQQMKNEAKQNILKSEQRCTTNDSNNDSNIRNIPKSNNPDIIIIPLKDYNAYDNEMPVDKQNAEIEKSDTVENNIKEETTAANLINSNNQNGPLFVEQNTNDSDIDESKSGQKVTQGEDGKIQAVAIESTIEESAPSQSKQDIVTSNAEEHEIKARLSNQENPINHIEEEVDKQLDKSLVDKPNIDKDSKLDLDKIEVCTDLRSAKTEFEEDGIYINKDNKKHEHYEECKTKSEDLKHLSEKLDLDKIEVCKNLSDVKLENEKATKKNHIEEKEDKQLDKSLVDKLNTGKDTKLDLDKIEVCNDLYSAKAELEEDDIYKNKDNKKQEHYEDCKTKSEDLKHLPEKLDLDKIEVCKNLSDVKLENEKDAKKNQEIHTDETSKKHPETEKQLEEKSVLNIIEVCNESNTNEVEVEVEKKNDSKKPETHVRTESRSDIKFDVEVCTLKENASAVVKLEENKVDQKLENIQIESIQPEKSKENVENMVEIECISNNQKSKAEATEAKRKQAVEEIQNIIIASVTQGIKIEDINNSLDDSGSYKDATTIINDIENEVKIIKPQVETFSGTADDNDFVALKDKLVRCMTKLENMFIEEDNKFKNQKKDVMKFTQEVLDMLQDNIVRANITNDKEEIGSDSVKK